MSKEYEKIEWRNFSPGPVVGVDEVGRGCLAGPVYAGAVCFHKDISFESRLTDSKALSEKQRDELSALICEHTLWALGSASVEEIDSINIFQASLLAMKRAIESLAKKMDQAPGHLLIDGKFKVPHLHWQGLRQSAFVKGDLRCTPISAAGIVAKVARDRLMKELSQEFPVYGFEKHKGYASEVHRNAIKKFGPSLHHRKTFAGVKDFVAPNLDSGNF